MAGMGNRISGLRFLCFVFSFFFGGGGGGGCLGVFDCFILERFSYSPGRSQAH